MNLILMGSPGVGKGTQSKRLSTMLGIPTISSGDMFREIRRQDTPLAHKVRGYMDRGEYVPDDLTIKMILDRLDEPDACDGFILDGFPRTVPQAKALDEALGKEGRHIDHVVLLQAPQDVVLKRLAGRSTCSKCGRVYNHDSNPPVEPEICDVCGSKLEQRSDEAPDVQRHRLAVFARQTEPVLAHYKASGRLEIVDACPPVDDVTEELAKMLKGVAPA